MATSAVRFSGNSVFIRDSDLGNWIQALTIQFQEIIENGEDIEWLLVSCNEWCDIYENLPPGLKDIELDKTLKDDAKELFFKGLLQSFEQLAPDEGEDLVVAKEVSRRLLKGLFSNS